MFVRRDEKGGLQAAFFIFGGALKTAGAR